MAKVSLRAYNREIEAMIDRGHLDEAIAHCQHILKTFPKHLETYRLLAKSYLEAKRHNEAVDIFSRVLVAEPSDFVSQVGMSIIRDEQNKLDDAIWHMERAFETQPSNAAIQGELQRLYGRRDGTQPPRIRMTRGALAHMYMQGELYPQAISETKSVLEEDAGRTDMQALLAKAYFKSGQKNDAADAASAVLNRYPYCLDANRVLTEILSIDRPDSAAVYRRRVFELDPYAAQVDGSVFESGAVSDAAVTLERLDWNGQPTGMPADWGSTSAISLESGSSDEQPDWLKSGLEETESPPPSAPASVSEQETSSSPEADTPAEPAEDIPDFLRAAGWGESTGAFDESKSSAMFDDEPESEAVPLEQGDMPDWVKAMAPQETSESTDNADNDDEEIPDWINKIGTDELPVPSDETPSEDQPDWLAQTDELSETSEPEMEAAVDQPVFDQPESSDEDEMDMLSELSSETDSPLPARSEDDSGLPESMESDDSEQTEPAVASTEARSDMTDTGNLGMGEQEQDDSFAWLENLAAKQGASEGLLTDPEDRLEEEPDWIKQAKSLSESDDQPAREEQPLPDEQPVPEQSTAVDQSMPEQSAVPDQPVSEQPVAADQPVSDEQPSATEPPLDNLEELGKSEEERDDSFAWLENLAAKQGATEGLLTKPEERREEEPEWVTQAKASDTAQTPVEQTAEQTSEEPEFTDSTPDEEALPSAEADEMELTEQAEEVSEKPVDEPIEMPEQEDQQAAEPAEPVAPVEGVTAWLDGLDEDELVDQAAPASTDDTAAWLKTLDEPEQTSSAPASSDEDDVLAWMAEDEEDQESETEAAVPVDEAAEDASDLPDWLEGLDEEESKPPAVSEDDGLPAWLQDETGELVAEPTKIEPTQSTDWTPEDEKEVEADKERDETPPPAASEPVPAADKFEPEPEPEPEPVRKPTPEKVEVKPAAPPEPYKEPATRKTTGMLEMPVDPVLGSARAELSRSNIPGALEIYGQL
ncbi:MAG TPA: tetratricopeptide repeat protein, partial [Anaerolineales bacterium]|nr:tetratricopeptide repeat protein [Anaerolineales bacterium]